MKRLIHTDLADAKTQRAIAVLRQVSPTRVSAEQARRVRAVLDAPARRRRRRAPAWLAGALLLGGATAAAAVGSGLISGGAEPPRVEASTQRRQAALPKAAPKPIRAPAESSSPPHQVPNAEEQPAPAGRRALAASAKPARASSQPAKASSNVALVHQAAKALRRDGDAERASKLLDSLEKHEHGPLAEEALALRIEAAMARGEPRAAALASAYLTRYPQGRYVDLARKAQRAASGR